MLAKQLYQMQAINSLDEFPANNNSATDEHGFKSIRI